MNSGNGCLGALAIVGHERERAAGREGLADEAVAVARAVLPRAAMEEHHHRRRYAAGRGPVHVEREAVRGVVDVLFDRLARRRVAVQRPQVGAGASRQQGACGEQRGDPCGSCRRPCHGAIIAAIPSESCHEFRCAG
jgi:hypothetical protein